MKKIIFMAVVLTSTAVLANTAAGAEHEAIVIPLHEIGWQALNLGILLAALIYFVKDSIVAAFANRKKKFIEQLSWAPLGKSYPIFNEEQNYGPAPRNSFFHAGFSGKTTIHRIGNPV